MGLDCVPLGRAKPGHEEEWNRLMELLYGGDWTEERWERVNDIAVTPFETLNPPRVGHDKEADDYMLRHKPKNSEKSDQEYLHALQNFPVPALLAGKCDGVSHYSIGMLFPSEDATWFRGKNLKSVEWIEFDLDRVWTDYMRPQDAVEYGESLLAAAARARSGELKEYRPPERKPEPEPRRWFDFLWARKQIREAPAEPAPSAEERAAQVEAELDLLEAAGRWYVFWGSRGHPIWAYY